MDKETAFVCSHVGVAGTTRVFVREVGKAGQSWFVARVGIAILGYTNRKDAGLKNANPFDEDFRDNYAEGSGDTNDLALEALRKDIEKTAETLWL
jgi:prophage antirepressor-like protein